MARILFCWELGGGLGHLLPLAEAGRALAAAGHEPGFALRDIAAVRKLLATADDTLPARVYQAPLFLPHWLDASLQPASYADILHAIGYRDADSLAAMLAAWQEIFEAFEPELIVFDHAPAAMLAARGKELPQMALASSGFTLPPSQHPLPLLRTVSGNAEDSARQAATAREDAVTDVINAALDQRGLPRIAAIGEIFETDAQLLLSISELDPYAPRTDGSVEYRGPLHASGKGSHNKRSHGEPPEWPEGSRPDNSKRVFVYARKFDKLQALLDVLAQSGASVLGHIGELSVAECSSLSRAQLRLVPELIDASQALAECDAVVTHGGSLCASALLAGKPVLTIPLYLEQHLTGERLQALGAGLNAPLKKTQGMQNKLHRLLHEKSFTEAAERIAAKYENTFAPFEDRFTRLVGDLLKAERS